MHPGIHRSHNKRSTYFLLLTSIFPILGVGLFYWYKTQPFAISKKVISSSSGVTVSQVQEVLSKNAAIIRIIESSGQDIAPNYESVVCTEFVIGVLERMMPLTAKTKKEIRIITNDDLPSLVQNDAPIIRGVQTALINAGIGEAVKETEVQAGDLIQFWNMFAGDAYGHCGFVVEVIPKEQITVYSSHPITNGFGRQTFLWPDKAYFVRLK
jgi:hypothetical protein